MTGLGLPVDIGSRRVSLETGVRREKDLAVRFRYEAGLLRLVRLDLLVLRADTTPSDAARQVSSAVMDELTADFEAVVYGGREATPRELDRSRTGWSELLTTASRR